MNTELAPDVRANRYDILSRMADDLAHEIKNPLNAIVVNLEVLRRRIEKGASESALERVDVIEQEIRRVHVLVEQLLQLARPSKQEPGPIAVDGLLNPLASTIQLQAKAARVKFEYVSESSLYAHVRPEALRFAVLNLISGAIDALAERGTGVVSLEVGRAGDAISMSVRSRGAELRADTEYVRLCGMLMQAAGGEMLQPEQLKDGVGSTITLLLPPANFA
ncbi:MAG TPA: HAMP domain-containing sensor histidine kinase [Longimicrobiales bacterium]|nr:HAMP domain-containing sensor histidine kinase [Longimicrobiales bacterium]